MQAISVVQQTTIRSFSRGLFVALARFFWTKYGVQAARLNGRCNACAAYGNLLLLALGKVGQLLTRFQWHELSSVVTRVRGS